MSGSKRRFELERGYGSIFDLETASGRAQLARPELTLEPLKGLVIIDLAWKMTACGGLVHDGDHRRRCVIGDDALRRDSFDPVLRFSHASVADCR